MSGAEPIDFAQLYRDQVLCNKLRPKPASAWDERARDYARNSNKSRYAEDFLERMDLSGARSVLDVGCGPGTLALPLAHRLERVVALDYSDGMLQQLQTAAAEAGVTNIQALHRAWEDDWSDVPVCDIAIASRSTTVDDLDAALAKLQRHARLRVYISCPMGGQFIDSDIVELLGIDVPRVPDHSLLLGMLQCRGVVPRLEVIQTPSRLAGCADFHAFADRVAWSTGPFDAAARARLQAWFEADNIRALAGGEPMRWAFVGWDAC